MMTCCDWLRVAFLKAPEDDTEEIQNEAISTDAKVICKDATVEVLQLRDNMYYD